MDNWWNFDFVGAVEAAIDKDFVPEEHHGVEGLRHIFVMVMLVGGAGYRFHPLLGGSPYESSMTIRALSY